MMGAGLGAGNGVGGRMGNEASSVVENGVEDEHYIQINNQRRRWMWSERSWVASGVGAEFRLR